MEVIIEPGKSGNVLATTAIGASYDERWKKFALPSGNHIANELISA